MSATAQIFQTPPQRQNFSSEKDRARLSATALKGYRRIAVRWGLTGQQSAALLDVSTSTWDRLKADNSTRTLSQDQMTRVSAVIGIYKGLNLLFADSFADGWLKLANNGPLFGGMTPVDSMIEGGIPQMLDVRRYIDAVRGGV